MLYLLLYNKFCQNFITSLFKPQSKTNVGRDGSKEGMGSKVRNNNRGK